MAEHQPPPHLGSGDTLSSIEVDEGVFSRDDVLRASYWFTDQYSVEVSRASEGKLAVLFRPKNPPFDRERLERDFRNALIDARLRTRIAEETAPIRRLIVAKAFAEGELLEDEPVGDWRDPIEAPNERPSKGTPRTR